MNRGIYAWTGVSASKVSPAAYTIEFIPNAQHVGLAVAYDSKVVECLPTKPKVQVRAPAVVISQLDTGQALADII